MRILTLLIMILAPLATNAGSIPADLGEALAQSGQVRVLVNLRAPNADGISDDARIALIVAARDRVEAQMPRSAHWRVVRQFSLVPAMALEVDSAAISALAESPDVESIALDVGGSGQMVESGPLASVPQAFAAGYTGAGGKIAVVDSGITLTHGDFAGRIAAQQCFCAGPAGSVGCCPNGLDSQAGAGSANDDHGHGTNVSGIAAGGGAVAQRGSAPAASIVAVKVLDSNNSFCCLSDVIAALDWIRVNHPDTDVVNASLGTNALFAGACDAVSFNPAMATAVNNLLAVGTMVFVSSGNQGSPTQMASPACIQNAIAVGAVWDAPRSSTTVLGCTDATVVTDQPTCFTNSNANTDLYAPGAFVTSSGIGGGLSTFGGTSQASPLSAGCATAIRARMPGATPAQIEAALKASPDRVTDSKNGLQFPRLDCEDAAIRVGGLFGNGFES
jgi:subtilisin family serine protease